MKILNNQSVRTFGKTKYLLKSVELFKKLKFLIIGQNQIFGKKENMVKSVESVELLKKLKF